VPIREPKSEAKHDLTTEKQQAPRYDPLLVVALLVTPMFRRCGSMCGLGFRVRY
jgi:hypothetical protein